MNHLVILRQPYLDLILAGRKTVESRLSRRKHAAARCQRGDTLYLKDAGGDIRAVAVARAVTVISDIAPGGVAELARCWGTEVAADGQYWEARSDARHAVFIQLGAVQPYLLPARSLPPRLPWRSGWIVGQPDERLVAASGWRAPVRGG